jgi:type IV pilus assembly protein PilB
MGGTSGKLGELLTGSGVISHGQLEEALEQQRTTGEMLGAVLVKKGYLSADQLSEFLEMQRRNKM